MRVILIPSGMLADTFLTNRLTAMLIGLVLFTALKRRSAWSAAAAFLVFLSFAAIRNMGILYFNLT
ncbi:MAG: hypothetical protein CML56_07150 [Rhodobacteraceae bacterium]|nr:hypothetical protein [Paracoccaceae bacterium]